MPSPTPHCSQCATAPSYGAFLTCCLRDATHYPAEQRMVRYMLGTLVLLGGLALLAVTGLLSGISGAVQRVAPSIPYVLVSTIAVAGAMWHLKAVRRDLSEMVAMMVGMTFGMIGGFLAGYLVGATNGMFTGSVFGVLVGCALGWIAGDCCAMMARMEGLMAGLMAGVMGAMTSVMLLNDRIAWFTPFLLVIALIILSGLAYLIHREHLERQGGIAVVRASGFTLFFVSCFAASALTIVIMVYGPRSFLFLS
ncbi:MAG: hypothetical protein Q7S96_01420 [bacterium]|nr:hypothetical protein [bacterium]